MLSTRSARLAAGLLLALLFGWAVRWQRLRHVAPISSSPPVTTPATITKETPRVSFPDE